MVLVYHIGNWWKKRQGMDFLNQIYPFYQGFYSLKDDI